MIKKTHLTVEFNYDAFRTHYGDKAMPLFLIKENGELLAFAHDNPPAPQPGHHLIALVGEITDSMNIGASLPAGAD